MFKMCNLRTNFHFLALLYFTFTAGGVNAAFSIPSHLSLHQVHLRNNDPSSSWCYAATVDPTKERVDNELAQESSFNFLATQVWPSARSASFFLEQYVDAVRIRSINNSIPRDNSDGNDSSSWKICELGCGPGLPSLVIAGLNLPQVHVIATDLDELALVLVNKAAKEQNFLNLVTERVDLTGDPNIIHKLNADLYVMSDVFENSAVAKGAAEITMKALDHGKRVWTFAQSDRAQREIYLQELEKLGAVKYGLVEWRATEDYANENADHLCMDQLILFDLDELTVNYG